MTTCGNAFIKALPINTQWLLEQESVNTVSLLDMLMEFLIAKNSKIPLEMSFTNLSE